MYSATFQRNNKVMHEPIVTRHSKASETLSASVWATGASSPTRHRVNNLSMCGACVDHEGELESGAATRVTIGRIVNVPAVISWVREGMAGIRFDHPIDLRDARDMRRRGSA